MSGFLGRLATKAGRGLRRLGVRALRMTVIAVVGAIVLVVLDALLLKDAQRDPAE